MDHPDLTILNFMENYIGLKMVKAPSGVVVFSRLHGISCLHERYDYNVTAYHFLSICLIRLFQYNLIELGHTCVGNVSFVND